VDRQLRRILSGQDGPCDLPELLRFQAAKTRAEQLNPDSPYTWQDFSLERVESRIDALQETVERLSRHPATFSADGEEVDLKHPDKGNLALLGSRQSVNFRVAERYAGIGARRRQQAMAEGKFTVVGAGKKRRITVESLLKYQPPLKNAK
jgi:hypothetical protein